LRTKKENERSAPFRSRAHEAEGSDPERENLANMAFSKKKKYEVLTPTQSEQKGGVLKKSL